MKKPELLAPAGDMECLKAAIEAGADAIYLGGRLFGARSFSLNFTDEEIIEAVKYAHIYGIKIYVTVNTIIYENEIDHFMEYIDFLHSSNVDAIIMQDIGMMDLVRKTYPNLEIHASTQMHIHNIEGVKLIEKLGLKRAVLARETSIDEIKKIKKSTNIELEIFVHGALCVSYSGQCLMSSLIGSRSGNRGTCSQCCRMQYDLMSNNKKVNNNEYLLSTKDLCTIENIKELIDANVDSLKIEGRMKRKEYVYLVVSIYRKAIDNYLKYKETRITKEDIIELKKIFNRDFTKGFLFNENNNDFVNQQRPNHIGIVIGHVIDYSNSKVKIKLNDELNQGDGIRIIGSSDVGLIINKLYKGSNLVNKGLKDEVVEFYIDGNIKINDVLVKTSDVIQLKSINEKLDKNTRKVLISGKIECKYNKPIKLMITDGINKVELESTYLVEQAQNSSTSEDRVKAQISKVGNTPYSFTDLEINIDNASFIKITELNEIRRLALEKLSALRQYKTIYKKEKYKIELKEYSDIKGLNALISTKKAYQKIKDDNYLEIFVDDVKLYNELKEDKRIVLKLPRVINDYKEYDATLLVGEMGSINKYNDIYTDFSLNVVNSYSVAYLHSMGVKRITLSYELNDKQIENIINAYKERYNKLPNLELIVSSFPEAMISKFNLPKYYNVEANNNYLKDRFHNQFKIESNDNFMTIYYYRRIELSDNDKYFKMGINRLRKYIEEK